MKTWKYQAGKYVYGNVSINKKNGMVFAILRQFDAI